MRLLLLRVRHTPTRLPINILYTSVDSMHCILYQECHARKEHAEYALNIQARLLNETSLDHIYVQLLVHCLLIKPESPAKGVKLGNCFTLKFKALLTV